MKLYTTEEKRVMDEVTLKLSEYGLCLDDLCSSASNNGKPLVIGSVPYQLCPKCGGDGNLLRYNSPPVMGTNANPICDVCDGKKIIPMAHFR